MADSVRSGRSRIDGHAHRSTRVEDGSRINPKIAATPVGTGGSGPLLPLPPSRPPARGRVVNREPAELGAAAAVPRGGGVPHPPGRADPARRRRVDPRRRAPPRRLLARAARARRGLDGSRSRRLLLPNVRMIGPTTVFTIAFLLPYALLRGPVRALVVFFVGPRRRHARASRSWRSAVTSPAGRTIAPALPRTSISARRPGSPRSSAAWPVCCSPGPGRPGVARGRRGRRVLRRRRWLDSPGVIHDAACRPSTSSRSASGLMVERHWAPTARRRCPGTGPRHLASRACASSWSRTSPRWLHSSGRHSNATATPSTSPTTVTDAVWLGTENAVRRDHPRRDDPAARRLRGVPAAARGASAGPRSCCSPRATRSTTGSPASTPAPTTTSRSRSASRSSTRGCAR